MTTRLDKPTVDIWLLSILFGLAITLNTVSSQDQATNCSINGGLALYQSKQNCINASWGGFIGRDCCGEAFNEYLYALAQRASLTTGQIFLDSQEQNSCLTTDKDISQCGVENLTSGGSGCSNFTIKDVQDRLGEGLNNLKEACQFPDKACTSCAAKWEDIGGSLQYGGNNSKAEADICRFSALIVLTSDRLEDKNWLQETYQCLGNQSIAIDEPVTRRGDIKSKTGMWILIGIMSGIAVAVAIVSLLLFLGRRTAAVPPIKEKELEVSESEDLSDMKISIKEVYAATDNLSPVNFIGQGVAGRVYKGILSNGQHVAVKHIIKEGQGDTYVREVTSMSDVQHPNLVTLFGYCENEEECFLIYELCHNGNLSEWLFGKDKALPWTTRLQIAIDSARGLWFLHTYPEGCIVHRDIKPTNILLSANFQAKLSDFGLSKVMDIGQSFVSSEVRGTFGYVDPEYRRNHRVNASGDVYSFGIVLLQLLSGQRVINLNMNRPMPIDRMAKVLTRGGSIAEFADPKINGEYTAEGFDLVLKLALSCTGLKQQRPSMEKVVSKLEHVLELSTKNKSPVPHKRMTDSNSSYIRNKREDQGFA
ncbi:hypothetical protein MLD38_008542 [Melastoma candidum]|uniref:Uncharacterized protein n=1 Tax=Melastoma candidum TaxID=119954 RepID=A0ACB9S365_9MYRT|nr:hypothetical protein MLD38_008542 [Melastoma candidum]